MGEDMNQDEIEIRMEELEVIAKEEYLKYTDFDNILNKLPKESLKEYNDLKKKWKGLR